MKKNKLFQKYKKIVSYIQESCVLYTLHFIHVISKKKKGLVHTNLAKKSSTFFKFKRGYSRLRPVSIQINLVDKPAAWLVGNDLDFAGIKGDVSPVGKGYPR